MLEHRFEFEGQNMIGYSCDAPDGSGRRLTDKYPNYYGAFVIDHDGNNIEACCHLSA